MTARDIIAGAVPPEVIAAAWKTWRVRHKDHLGPGPAFVEAITAAVEAYRAAGYRIVPPPAPPEPERPGVYLNLETGLIRTFPYDKPRRGKWEFVKPLSRRALRESGG